MYESKKKRVIHFSVTKGVVHEKYTFPNLFLANSYARVRCSVPHRNEHQTLTDSARNNILIRSLIRLRISFTFNGHTYNKFHINRFRYIVQCTFYELHNMFHINIFRYNVQCTFYALVERCPYGHTCLCAGHTIVWHLSFVSCENLALKTKRVVQCEGKLAKKNQEIEQQREDTLELEKQFEYFRRDTITGAS